VERVQIKKMSTIDDKFAILNVTKIIDMIEEAKQLGYSDIEQLYFTLDELLDILRSVDGLEKINKMVINK